MLRIPRRLRGVALGALIAAGVGALAPAAAIGEARVPRAPAPSPPAADDPALPHGAGTLQALAGGHPSTRALASGGVQGIDVASYQHPGGAAINWGQVASAGYRFAFVKATQGTYYTNPYFSGDYAAVAAAGMFRAAYHFADPSVSSGTAQADYLLNAAPNSADGLTLARSEERRVGKECSLPCRSRWSPYH